MSSHTDHICEDNYLFSEHMAEYMKQLVKAEAQSRFGQEFNSDNDIDKNKITRVCVIQLEEDDTTHLILANENSHKLLVYNLPTKSGHKAHLIKVMEHSNTIRNITKSKWYISKLYV